MKKLITTLVIVLLGITISYAQEDISYEQHLDIVTSTEELESEITTDEQNNSVTSRNQYFDLEIIKIKQNPLNKEILFRLNIKPKIDSSRTQLIWDGPSSVDITPNHSSYVSLKQNNNYSYEAVIKPNKGGSFNITATALSWQHDTNKSNSVNYTLKVTNSLVAQPTDIQYILTLLLFILGIVLLTIGVVYGIVKGVQLLILNFKKWITPPL